MLVPARRVHYPPLVLMLADAAVERIRRELAAGSPAPDGHMIAPLEPGPS